MPETTRFLVYFAIKREIHRRFTADQKLGNIFEWTGKRLVFREPIIRFMTEGLRYYEDDLSIPDEAAIDTDMRKLANRLFGELRRESADSTAINHEHHLSSGGVAVDDQIISAQQWRHAGR